MGSAALAVRGRTVTHNHFVDDRGKSSVSQELGCSIHHCLSRLKSIEPFLSITQFAVLHGIETLKRNAQLILGKHRM
jgi:hypothetical protein